MRTLPGHVHTICWNAHQHSALQVHIKSYETSLVWGLSHAGLLPCRLKVLGTARLGQGTAVDRVIVHMCTLFQGSMIALWALGGQQDVLGAYCCSLARHTLNSCPACTRAPATKLREQLPQAWPGHSCPLAEAGTTKLGQGTATRAQLAPPSLVRLQLQRATCAASAPPPAAPEQPPAESLDARGASLTDLIRMRGR